MAKDKLITKEFFTSLPFWSKLGAEERSAVQRETQGLMEAHVGETVLRYHQAEHLFNLQATLEGKGFFVKYLKSLKYSYRTAYRYIEAYKEVRGRVPEHVLKLAAARGMDLVGFTAASPFGPYTEPIKALPPVPTAEDKVPHWLDQLEEKRASMPRRARRARVVNPETALKEAFRGATAQFKRIPVGRGRTTWAKRLIGMLLLEFGLPGQAFEPEAVPEGFRPVVGRPRTRVA